ncbi:hypothetical protein, partial [Rhizobium mesoamericanum]|uniref:hypothetical protein n=1 Tax=Rhizobium mesoamericanum TaxID=1079800 RepID=UPI0027D8F8B1
LKMPAIRPQRGPQIKPKNLKAFSLRPSPDAYVAGDALTVNRSSTKARFFPVLDTVGDGKNPRQFFV